SEREGKLVLLLELVVRGDAVAGDADHRGLDLPKFGKGIAEAAGFGGAAGGVVLGIEIKHDLLPAQLRQADLAAPVGRKGEVRRLVADLDAHDDGVSSAERKG